MRYTSWRRVVMQHQSPDTAPPFHTRTHTPMFFCVQRAAWVLSMKIMWCWNWACMLHHITVINLKHLSIVYKEISPLLYSYSCMIISSCYLNVAVFYCCKNLFKFHGLPILYLSPFSQLFIFPRNVTCYSFLRHDARRRRHLPTWRHHYSPASPPMSHSVLLARQTRITTFCSDFPQE